jgi:RNA polymerase sigma-70 factor (ECF subfamily)
MARGNAAGGGGDDLADPDDLPSIELVRMARAGDRQALERLFARYLPVLRRWASGRLPRWARDLLDTDDMIQETMIRTLRRVEHFVPRHDGAFGAYLRQALNNRIRDEIRKARARPKRVELADDHAGGDASPLERAIGNEALKRYEASLARLDEDDQALVLSRIELGMSYKEIAIATKRPSPDAARMAVGRALVKLAEGMGHA